MAHTPRRTGHERYDTYAVTGVDYGNVIYDTFRMPDRGWIYEIRVHVGGSNGPTTGKLALWDGESGQLAWSSGEQAWGAGRDWRSAPLGAQAVPVEDRQRIALGFWRDPKQPAAVSLDWRRWGPPHVDVQTHLTDRDVPPLGAHDNFEHMILAAVAYYHPQERPSKVQWIDPTPAEGSVSNLRPIFSGLLLHEDDADFDYTERVHIRVTRRNWPHTVAFSEYIEVTPGATTFTYQPPSPLTASTSYTVQVRHQDSWGSWSPWATRHFETSAGPDAPVLVNPTGRITVQKPTEFRGSFSTPLGPDFSRVQIEIWNESRKARLYQSGDQTSTQAVTNPGEWVVGNAWMATNLAWGKKYYWRARVKDASGAYGAWSPMKLFFTNAAPRAPYGLTPTGGRPTGSRILRAQVTDPDNDPITQVDYEVRRKSDSVVVASGTMSIASDNKTATVDPGVNVVADITHQWRARASDGSPPSPGEWSLWNEFVYAPVPTVDMISPAGGVQRNLVNQPSAEHDPAVVGAWWTEMLSLSRNLLSEGASTAEVADPSSGAYNDTVVTRSTDRAWQGTQSWKVDTTGMSAHAHIHGIILSAPVANLQPANTSIVSSAYVWAPSGTSITISGRPTGSANEYLGENFGLQTYTGTGAWQRIETTPWTYTSGSFRPNCQIVIPQGVVAIFYVDGAQSEVKSTAGATSWISGAGSIVAPGSPLVTRMQDDQAFEGKWSWRGIAAAFEGPVFISGYMSVDPLRPYYFSTAVVREVGQPTAQMHLRVEAYNSAGTLLGTLYPGNFPNGTDPGDIWTEVEGYIGPTGWSRVWPAGTTQCRVLWEPSRGKASIGRIDRVFMKPLPSTLTAANETNATPWQGTFDGDFAGFGSNPLDYEWEVVQGNSAQMGLNILQAPQANIVISYSSPGNSAKNADRVYIDRWTGAAWLRVHDTGFVTSNRTVIPLPTNVILNEGRYRITVEARDSGAPARIGQGDPIEFDVRYDGPASLVIESVDASAEAGTIEVAWRGTSLSQLDFAGYEVAVEEWVGQSERKIVEFISNPQRTSYVYPWPVSGKEYSFLVRQLQNLGNDQVAGRWSRALGRVDYRSWFLKDLRDPTNYTLPFEIQAEDAPDFVHKANTVALRPWGSEVPVHLVGEERSTSGTVIVKFQRGDPNVKDKEFILHALAERRQGAGLLTTDPEAKYFVQLVEMSEVYTDMPWSTVWTIKWEQTTFEEDYYLQEGITSVTG